eukprot:TRINITY_DN9758_c1_g3_i3.p3 TRINITY_DN9758_c1_g3~~TRINITY_DN9758_c1_g3_i3.p3  ORF type:complete len:174 (-),score=21.77 TRINITY_DN9758_c1_g3_i3:277-798(-)
MQINKQVSNLYCPMKQVEFSILNIIPGWVGLRGRFEGVEGSKDTVKVIFDPPVICLLNLFSFNIGPKSRVQLQTTYLDEQIRLGKGGQGSLFVFKRGGEADNAEMESVGLQTGPRKWLGTILLCGFLVWLAVSGWGFLQSVNIFTKLLGTALMFFAGAFGWVAYGALNPTDPV